MMGAAVSVTTDRKGEAESRAFAGRGFRPDCAAMPLDDFFADGQTDSGALVCSSRVQPLEYLEYTLGVRHVKSDTIVANGDSPVTVIRDD